MEVLSYSLYNAVRIAISWIMASTPGFPMLCGERLEELCHMFPWYDSFATSLTQNQDSQLTMNWTVNPNQLSLLEDDFSQAFWPSDRVTSTVRSEWMNWRILDDAPLCPLGGRGPLPPWIRASVVSHGSIICFFLLEEGMVGETVCCYIVQHGLRLTKWPRLAWKCQQSVKKIKDLIMYYWLNCGQKYSDKRMVVQVSLFLFMTSRKDVWI